MRSFIPPVNWPFFIPRQDASGWCRWQQGLSTKDHSTCSHICYFASPASQGFILAGSQPSGDEASLYLTGAQTNVRGHMGSRSCSMSAPAYRAPNIAVIIFELPIISGIAQLQRNCPTRSLEGQGTRQPTRGLTAVKLSSQQDSRR